MRQGCFSIFTSQITCLNICKSDLSLAKPHLRAATATLVFIYSVTYNFKFAKLF